MLLHLNGVTRYRSTPMQPATFDGESLRRRARYMPPQQSHTPNLAPWKAYNQLFHSTLPALSSWVARLGGRPLQVKTIQAYLTGAPSAHDNMSFVNQRLFHCLVLPRNIGGIGRMRKRPKREQRRHITRGRLLQMLGTCDKDTLLNANLDAAFCLAFTSFPFIGESTCSADDPDDPDLQSERSLPASKTESFNQGVTFLIAGARNDAYIVAILCFLSSLPLFLSFEKFPLFSIGTGFSRQ